MKKYVAGFDPGGKNKFGWCIVALDDPHDTDSGTVNCADEAYDKMQKTIDEKNGQIVAAGIDAPLYWMRNGGSRKSDDYVRFVSKASSGTVQSVNSLWGACLIQGFLLSMRIELEHSNCIITETHPKALLKISNDACDFGNRHSASEHERDALISAWAATQCYHGNKGQNLFCCENKKDIHVFLKKTMYWWPFDSS